MTHTVTWTPPTTWPTGASTIKAIVYGDDGDTSKAFKNDTVFTMTLSAATTTTPDDGEGATLPGAGADEVTSEDLEEMDAEDAADAIEELTDEEAS
ncbi:hypothetical protein ACFLV0_06230 [Chloroflexota bacterium]